MELNIPKEVTKFKDLKVLDYNEIILIGIIGDYVNNNEDMDFIKIDIEKFMAWYYGKKWSILSKHLKKLKDQELSTTQFNGTYNGTSVLYTPTEKLLKLAEVINSRSVKARGYSEFPVYDTLFEAYMLYKKKGYINRGALLEQSGNIDKFYIDNHLRYLKKQGLIESERYGLYYITKEGYKLLKFFVDLYNVYKEA